MKLIIYLILLSFFQPQSQPANWELAKEKEGISIYTRPQADSNFKEFKAICHINLPLNEIAAYMTNADNFAEWNYQTHYAELIKRDANKQWIYAQTKAPWPILDRDVVIEQEVTQSSDGKTITIHNQSAPDMLPRKKGMVRITKNKGYWKLEMLEKNLTRLTFSVASEPGGKIPHWMANMASTETPYQTITKLKSGLKIN